MKELQDLLSRKEAGEYLRCSTRTVDRLRQKGKLKWFKLKGRVVLRKESLETYIKESEKAAETL